MPERIARSLAHAVIPSRARDRAAVSFRRIPGHTCKTCQTLIPRQWVRFSMHVFRHIHSEGTNVLVGGVHFFVILAKVAGVGGHG